MNVPIPPEFEVFARRQVLAGAVTSEEEAVAIALQSYLEDVARVQALIDPALASLDRGEGIDGETFMQELLAKAKARVADKR